MQSRATTRELPAFAWRRLLAVAAVITVVLLVVSNRYGFHRDELYFLEAGQHLAFGYVDQPPLVPVLARLQSALFGASPWALRVVPALVTGVIGLLAGALARELGGSRRGQVWSAVAVGGAGFVLAVGHLLATATFDFAFWLVLIIVVARLLRTGDPRWWTVYGAVAGVALWNKHLPVMLTAAVLVGLAVGRRVDLLATWWLVAGGVVAVGIAAPTLVWQASNGWPQLEMAAALSDRIGGESRATLLPLQLVMLGPLMVPLGIGGLRWMRGPAGRVFLPLAWAYVAALVLTLASGGRPYYPLPLASALIVAGAVAWSSADVRPRRTVALLGAHVVLGALLALPLLPARVVVTTPIPELNDTLVETIGWRQLTRQVTDAVAGLPASGRDSVVLLTGSYGEAGALDRYGPELGLPEPYSGHNSYADWRRPADPDATVVGVRLRVSSLEEHFGSCREVDQVRFAFTVDNEVDGAPIVVCSGLRGTWDDVWPRLRHLE